MSCSWEIAQILQLIENLVVCRKAGSTAQRPYSVVYLCGGLGGGHTLLTLLAEREGRLLACRRAANTTRSHKTGTLGRFSSANKGEHSRYKDKHLPML